MAGQDYRDRVDAALRSGAPRSALDIAVAAYAASDGNLLTAWGEAVQLLGRQPAGMRALLLEALVARYEQAPSGSGVRLGLLHLGAVLGRDLDSDVLVAERREAVAAIAHRWAVRDHARLYLAHTEVSAGRPLSPAAVATVRRSALLLDDPGWTALAARLGDPVLNVGERWSDAALADISVLGSDWRGLVAHAGAARAAKPTPKWERTARGLLSAVGEEEAGKRIRAWLDLVGQERTLALAESGADGWGMVAEQMDPFNANVLRGLVLLLSCTGPDEETVAVLGSLVDTCLKVVPRFGPRAPKAANAAVNALGRLGEPAALAELRRLAAETSHGNTRRQILRWLPEKWWQTG
ncbi:hypothetical protein GCM10010129_83170 [Streptomyces fumigatiscleroticus]|nr:hypothetical protein GCM10010129_83170 [Streptomyces fumigatiscleroticus]